MGTGELRPHVLGQAAARVKSDSLVSTSCAPDMVSYHDKQLGTNLRVYSNKQDTRTDGNTLVTTCLQNLEPIGVLWATFLSNVV